MNSQKQTKTKTKPKKKYVYRGQYLPYERAKRVVGVLSLSSRFAYADWYAEHKPDYLPKRPDRAYKIQFEGWVEFLGKTTKKSTKNLEKIKYYKKIQNQKRKEKEKEVKQLKKQVDAYVKYELRQADFQAKKLKKMESTALRKYRKVERSVDRRLVKPVKIVKYDPSRYLDYETAKAIVRKEQLNTYAEYQCWWDDNKPKGIPKIPYKAYEDFKLHDFLGTPDRTPEKFKPINYREKYRPYDEAIRFVRTLGLSTVEEWKEFIKSSKCPKDIPRYPDYAYRYRPSDPNWGKWKSWDDWLGKDINLRLEAFREQQKALILIIPDGAPAGVYSFIYKSGTQQDIDNYIDENELYVIRIYKIETYDWAGYLNRRYGTYMGKDNTFIIPNINEVLFDLDDYMTRIL